MALVPWKTFRDWDPFSVLQAKFLPKWKGKLSPNASNMCQMRDDEHSADGQSRC